MKIDFPDELNAADVAYRPNVFRILQEEMVLEGKTSFQFLKACNEFDPSFFEWITIIGAVSEQFDDHLRAVNQAAICISCKHTIPCAETDHWERCPEHPAGQKLQDMASRIVELSAKNRRLEERIAVQKDG